MLALEVYDRGNKVVLEFEHSLLSLSKWESKSRLPFLTRGPKSPAELIDYYRDMLISPEHDPDLVYRLSPGQLDQLSKYLSDPMSAGAFPEQSDGPKHGTVTTSDTIYMQMVILKIPFETQTWHLNRLMLLIAKVAHQQQPPKKESKAQALTRWMDTNRKNREFFKSKG